MAKGNRESQSPASLKRKQREANKVDPPPVSFTQNTAAKIEDNKASAPLPAPPKETHNATTLTKDNSIQSSAGNDTSQLKLPKEADAQSINGEEAVKTLTGPTPAASEKHDLPEQTSAGARVAMSVTPAPNVKETAAPAVTPIPWFDFDAGNPVGGRSWSKGKVRRNRT